MVLLECEGVYCPRFGWNKRNARLTCLKGRKAAYRLRWDLREYTTYGLDGRQAGTLRYLTWFGRNEGLDGEVDEAVEKARLLDVVLFPQQLGGVHVAPEGGRHSDDSQARPSLSETHSTHHVTVTTVILHHHQSTLV